MIFLHNPDELLNGVVEVELNLVRGNFANFLGEDEHGKIFFFRRVI